MLRSALPAWKNGIVSWISFFLTIIVLSTSYAALSSSLSTADIVASGSWLTAASWNRIVNSILELDDRTSSISASGSNIGIGAPNPSTKLEIGGQIKITGWSPWAWKILTSDAVGLANWKSGISQTTIDAFIPINQTVSGSCDGVGATLAVTTPGFYGIQLHADAYLYVGNFNNLSIWLADSLNTILCMGTTANAGAGGWMYPTAYCIEHLDVGMYTIKLRWSDSSSCTTSKLDRILSWYGKLRLLSAD